MSNSNTSFDIEQCEMVYKALANAQRLKIMYLLCHVDNRVTVSEFANVFDDYQSNASRQLKILKDAGLLQKHREGKCTYYSIPDENTVDPFLKAVIVGIRALPDVALPTEINRCKELCEARCPEESSCGGTS